MLIFIYKDIIYHKNILLKYLGDTPTVIFLSIIFKRYNPSSGDIFSIREIILRFFYLWEPTPDKLERYLKKMFISCKVISLSTF
jgi:hypothetical protein